MGSFGLVNSYTMPMPLESASLFPSRSKFIVGGDDMWVHLFDSTTGDEISELSMCSFSVLLGYSVKND
jgi:serine-threonine kinase receptor-associated protein